MNICSNCPAKSVCEINSFIKNKSDIAVINIESCRINDNLSGQKVSEETKVVDKRHTTHAPVVNISEIMVDEEGDEPSSDNILSLISDREIEKPDSNIITSKDEFMQSHPDMVQCDICKTIVPSSKAKNINGKIFCDRCWGQAGISKIK